MKVGMSMSFSPSTSGGTPARIDVASEVVSSLIEVSVSFTFRLLWVALNSLTSFWARVLDTVRAQNCTVPVALTPKFADPGDAAAVAAGVEPDDEHPATAAATRAAAEKSAILVLFMCAGSFKTSSALNAARRAAWRHGSERGLGHDDAAHAPGHYDTSSAAGRSDAAGGYGPRRLRPAFVR